MAITAEFGETPSGEGRLPAGRTQGRFDAGEKPGPKLDVNPLELAATLVTLACVILGVKRSLWQFPVGIVGTALFFVVVLQAGIYANAALQVFFVFVQIYGWWYWLRGARLSVRACATRNRST